jgi:hypothetical protein
MPVVEDSLWKNPGNPGMIVVTSHANVLEDGRLFMEYDPAREAIRRIPDIDLQCGQQVLSSNINGVYGFLPVRPSIPEKRLVGFGLFQTQMNWDESPDPELIRFSMDCLREYADTNPEVKIRMNFPGSKNNSLNQGAIARLLLPLPANLTVCHQGQFERSFPTSFPGFKSVYLQVEGMIQNGQLNQAVDYLIKSGFDIQSAMEQAKAVERMLRERHDRESEHVRRWRNSHVGR